MKISKPSANQIMNTDKHSSTQRKIWTYPLKNLFLAIQLSEEFGFDLETPIFLTIQLLKPFIFSSLVILIGGFTYMDGTCWGPTCQVLFPFLSSFLFLLFPSLPLMAVGAHTCHGRARPPLSKRRMLLATPCATIGCRWRCSQVAASWRLVGIGGGDGLDLS
jgi:hypothetical protein